MAAELGIFPQYIARKPETIVLQDKIMSLSGGSADITLLGAGPSGGAPLFRVDGKTMSLKGRRSVTDAATNAPLFDIVKEHMHLHATYAAVDPSGKKLLEVKSHFSLIGSKADVSFTDQSGRARTLLMKGDWASRSADIEDEKGVAVARISRKFGGNVGRELMGGQTYAVEIMPGVDMALVVAMCICLDAKKDADRGS